MEGRERREGMKREWEGRGERKRRKGKEGGEKGRVREDGDIEANMIPARFALYWTAAVVFVLVSCSSGF